MSRQTEILQKHFGGRKLLIATRHHKDRVLRALLESHLGVEVIVTKTFDTDRFGTFTGEVPRQASPFDTVRQKCIAAHEATGVSLVLASEGSFGAHPVMGFVPADEEILLLKDFERQTEYRAKVISTATNFSGAEHFEWEQVLFFASQVKFPSHALIVKQNRESTTDVHKDIVDWATLKSSFYHFKQKYGKAFVETDMRAMHNPTRMKVIAEAGEKLLRVISTVCPICEAPGFEVTDVVRGLPCSYCSSPTPSARAFVHECQHCGHTETRPHPHKKQQEDPMYCDECNP